MAQIAKLQKNNFGLGKKDLNMQCSLPALLLRCPTALSTG
jgi:hypothetical protein